MRIHSPYPASWALAQRIGYLYSEGEIIYLADTPFERLLDIQRQVGQCQTMTSLSQADFEARLEAVFHQNTGESQQIAQDIDQSVDLLSLSEEMPATEEEVGKYAVKVLFRDDVEEADLYGYSHLKTEEGIVVSLFKYRLHIDENSDRVVEFFAMAQEMQKDGFTVESMGDTVLLTLGVDNLGADDVFGWTLLAVVAVVAALAATAAAIYIKRNKKYREKHKNDLC